MLAVQWSSKVGIGINGVEAACCHRDGMARLREWLLGHAVDDTTGSGITKEYRGRTLDNLHALDIGQ